MLDKVDNVLGKEHLKVARLAMETGFFSRWAPGKMRHFFRKQMN